MFQIGVVPGRIDVLTQLSGLLFDEAWPTRLRGVFGSLDVDFIGRDVATGRAKDRIDVQSLE